MKYQKEVLGFVGINFQHFCSFKGGRPKKVYSQKLGSNPSWRQISTLQDSAVPFPLCSNVGFHTLFTLRKIEWNLSVLKRIVKKKKSKTQYLPCKQLRLAAARVGRYCDGFKEWRICLPGLHHYRLVCVLSSGVVSAGVTPWLALGKFSSIFKTECRWFSVIYGAGGKGLKCTVSLIYSSLALVVGDQTWQLVEMVFGYLSSVFLRLIATSLQGSNVAMINNFKTT